MFREVITQQVTQDDTPQVEDRAAAALWRDGSDRRDAPACARAHSRASVPLEGGRHFDTDGYLDALERLPLPSAERVEQLIIEVVRDRQPVDADEVDLVVAQELDLPLDDPLTDTLLDKVHQYLLDDAEDPLAMLAPDRLVHL